VKLVVVLLIGFAAARSGGGVEAATAIWPHLRGPAHDGHSRPLPPESAWGADGPALVWRARLGEGYSGFVVVGDRAYTQSQTLAGQYVIALDLASGSEIWRTRYEPPWDADGNWPGPYATPTYHDGRLFFAGCFGSVGAVDATTGALLWQRTAKQELVGTYKPHPAWPLYAEPYLMVPLAFRRGSVVVELGYRGEEPTVVPVWQSKVFSNDVFSSVVVAAPTRVEGRWLGHAARAVGGEPCVGRHRDLGSRHPELVLELDDMGRSLIIRAFIVLGHTSDDRPARRDPGVLQAVDPAPTHDDGV